MKKNLLLRSLAFSLALGFIFTSCVSTTTIQSTPPGADVYIDGYRVGKTPYLYADNKIVGSTTLIDLKKEGYEPLYTTLSRTEELEVGALVGGLFTWIPFLWIMKYRPMHTYTLIPLEQNGDMVEEAIIEQKAPEAKKFSSKAAQLKELKELLDADIITQEEFDAEKAKILNAE